MNHFSFQLVDLKKAIMDIDQARYTNPYSPKTPSEPDDFDNEENLFNRLKISPDDPNYYLPFLTYQSYGDNIGLFIGVSDKVRDRLIRMKNIRSADPQSTSEDLACFDNFEYDEATTSLTTNPDNILCTNFITFDQITGKFYLYSVPDYVLYIMTTEGFSTQLENIDNGYYSVDNYILEGLKAVYESDMQDDKKDVMTKAFLFLFQKQFGRISGVDFASSMYTEPLTSSTSSSYFLNSNSGLFNSRFGPFKYYNTERHQETCEQFESIYGCLKMADALEDYNENGDFSYPNFTIYALLVSAGIEGKNDSCCLENIEIGKDITYETEETEPIEAHVEIIPLPRNRAKIRYTIETKPNQNGKIEFKVTY